MPCYIVLLPSPNTSEPRCTTNFTIKDDEPYDHPHRGDKYTVIWTHGPMINIPAHVSGPIAIPLQSFQIIPDGANAENG